MPQFWGHCFSFCYSREVKKKKLPEQKYTNSYFFFSSCLGHIPILNCRRSIPNETSSTKRFTTVTRTVPTKEPGKTAKINNCMCCRHDMFYHSNLTSICSDCYVVRCVWMWWSYRREGCRATDYSLRLCFKKCGLTECVWRGTTAFQLNIYNQNCFSKPKTLFFISSDQGFFLSGNLTRWAVVCRNIKRQH